MMVDYFFLVLVCFMFLTHSFSMKLKVFCDFNYYGPGCNTYCVSRNDGLGHFTCNALTGERDCIYGRLNIALYPV